MTANAAAYQLSKSVDIPANCRQRLAAEGKPYPRSSCAVCGKFSPRWRECDAALNAAAGIQLDHAEISSDIKQANTNTVAGALLLLADIAEEKAVGLTTAELEFVCHCRDLAQGVSQ